MPRFRSLASVIRTVASAKDRKGATPTVVRDRRWRHAAWPLIPAFLSALLLAACTVVPEPMQVRSGVDPRNQDDKVRFRTTYYFRVSDVCRDVYGDAVNGPPKLDSLYRFRMTGKASALFAKVHFESGTLHKTEIDPFGSSIVFDEKLGRHRFVSREETDAAVQREERDNDIRRRVELLKDIGKSVDRNQEGAASEEVKQIIKDLGSGIRRKVAGIEPPTGNPSSKLRGEMSKEGRDSNNADGCPKGTELQRGFQIIGPEGLATFNQDQRLIMAMTSSGKPLIGALKELSGRMLREHGSGRGIQSALAQENVTAQRAQRVVSSLENDPNVPIDQLVERIIDAFGQDVPQDKQ